MACELDMQKGDCDREHGLFTVRGTQCWLVLGGNMLKKHRGTFA